MQGDRKKTKRQYGGPSLSLVFPAYNEQENISKALELADNYARKNFSRYEIIVVNDGSKDETRTIVEQVKNKNKNIKLINHSTNLGYGRTIWDGLKASQYENIFFTDSDLQFDIAQISDLTKQICNYDVVIGYRVKRQDHFLRKVNMVGWKWLVRFFLRLEVRDVDCAFKLFRKHTLDNLNIESGGATFSAELLYRLKKKGYRIKEVPVNHFSRKAGNPTGAKPAVILRAIKELVKLSLSRSQ